MPSNEVKNARKGSHKSKKGWKWPGGQLAMCFGGDQVGITAEPGGRRLADICEEEESESNVMEVPSVPAASIMLNAYLESLVSPFKSEIALSQ